MHDETSLQVALNKPSTQPLLLEENAKQSGYNVILYDGSYFAVYMGDGAFDIQRVRRGEYVHPPISADTIGEMYAVLEGEQQSEELRAKHLLAHVRMLESFVSNVCRFVPPGHYYSPIPSDEDIRQYPAFDPNVKTSIPAVEFDLGRHALHLQQMADEYLTLPTFHKNKTEKYRFYYGNGEHSYFDAISSRHFIRRYKPKHVVEVGCGFSSAVMLDSAEEAKTGTQFTFIEPHPERLLGLLSPGDLTRHNLIKEKVQNIPFALFETLERNDILFIDSSHVTKFMSDVNHYVFEILPRIKSGVFVHIHDIGFPFEYPKEMLEEGRSWNEAYLLRAFLMYNKAFEIEYWSAYASHFQGEYVFKEMPLCRQMPGGSFWMRRA
jgi:hypothetical protein